MLQSPEGTVQNNTALAGKVALVTGAARRVGAELVRALHAGGFNVVLHYRRSQAAAQQVQRELNARRENSVVLIQADLLDTSKLAAVVQQAARTWGRLDALINNASSFYPTAVGKVGETEWNDLVGTNLKAPFFLAQAAAPYLARHGGCIINIADIHGERPLKNFCVYSVAKAGLAMLTRSLACELGPEVRVNAVAPGAILWPEEMDELAQQRIISRTFLKRQGSPADVAKAVLFLLRDADYMTGQVLTIDGGRSLNT